MRGNISAPIHHGTQTLHNSDVKARTRLWVIIPLRASARHGCSLTLNWLAQCL